MAFRGCIGMTGDQTGAIYTQLGGRNNADTQQTITQFFTTVPALPPDAEERGVAVKHALIRYTMSVPSLLLICYH